MNFRSMAQLVRYYEHSRRDPRHPLPEVEEVGTVAGVTIHFVRLEGRVWKEVSCHTR